MAQNINLIKKNENFSEDIINNNLRINKKLNLDNKGEKENNKILLDYSFKKNLNKIYLYGPKKQHFIDYNQLFNKVFLPKEENEFIEINNIMPIKKSIKDAINNIFIDNPKKRKNNSINKNKGNIKTKILSLSKELYDNPNNNKQNNYNNELKTDRIIYDNKELKKYKRNFYLPKILTQRNNTTGNHASINYKFRNPILHILNRNNHEKIDKLPSIKKINKRIKINI